MATDTATAPQATIPAPDDLGIDREFLLMLARLPLIAAGMVLATWLSAKVVPVGPVVLLCAGMILAAVIDGIKFKVPNWLTLSMILAGWGLGALNSFGIAIGPGPVEAALREAYPASGGIGAALIGTVVAFFLLFPVFFLGGMGQGDVKMQAAFGAWVGALYGADEGLWTIVYAVCAGYIIGGILGFGMILLRGQLHRNLSNVKEIFADLKLMATAGPKAASQRAHARRATWHRLPYGIPLCIGFVGYLGYLHWWN
ncbi:MAG: A24 family peptidase [Gemmataceae bacterium]